jgi:phage gp29-like protein
MRTMAEDKSKQNPTPPLGEILSSEQMGAYLNFSGGLGGGQIVIPDNPTVVWPQLFWNYPFAMYVYDDMEEKDDKVGADLDTRKEAVLSKPRFVKPASDKLRDKKIATFIEETLEEYMGGSLVSGRLPFDNALWEMMDAIGNGVAIAEIEWSVTSDRVFCKDLHFKPQQLFSFSESPFGNFAAYGGPQTGPLRLRPGLTIDGVGLEGLLPQDKFFVHTYRPKRGNRWGSPLKRRCFWWAWFKKGGLLQWMRMLEKGPGTAIARYDQGESEAQRALQLAQAITEEAQVAVPKRVEVEILEHVRGQMGSIHKDLVDDICNNAITRIILGQTLTSRGSEGGGSRALGEVHERVAQKKTEVDAKSLMIAVNTQLVWPIVLFNFGPVEKPPIWTIQYEPGADVKLATDVLDRAWRWKLEIPKSHVRDTLQIPAPKDGEEILEPPSPDEQMAPTPGDKTGESAAFAERLQKKKFQRRSSDTRLKPPISKTGRCSSLRPSMMRFSDR